MPVRRQPREVGGAAQLLEMLVAFEIGLQRHRAGGGPTLHHGKEALHDLLVRGHEEVFGPQRVGQFLVDAVVDQDRAQKRGFGFHVGRQGARAFHRAFLRGTGGR